VPLHLLLLRLLLLLLLLLLLRLLLLLLLQWRWRLLLPELHLLPPLLHFLNLQQAATETHR
jgi:hypothetical protein